MTLERIERLEYENISYDLFKENSDRALKRFLTLNNFPEDTRVDTMISSNRTYILGNKVFYGTVIYHTIFSNPNDYDVIMSFISHDGETAFIECTF